MHELTIIPEAWTCFKILCLIGDTRHSHMRWQTPMVKIREAGNSEGARSSGIGRGRDESTWKVWNSSHENNGRRRAAAVTDAGHGLGPKLALLTQPGTGTEAVRHSVRGRRRGRTRPGYGRISHQSLARVCHGSCASVARLILREGSPQKGVGG